MMNRLSRNYRLFPAMPGLLLCGLLLLTGCSGRETGTIVDKPNAPGYTRKHSQAPTLPDILPETDMSDPARFILACSNKEEYVISFRGKKDTVYALKELRAFILKHRPEITSNEVMLVPEAETKLTVMTQVIDILKENKLGMRLIVNKEGQ